MTQESLALAKTLQKYDLVAMYIANSAGTNRFEFSRLCTGKKDVYSSLMFKIIKAMPMESRFFFLLSIGIFDFDDRQTDLQTLLQSLKQAWMLAETDSEFLQN